MAEMNYNISLSDLVRFTPLKDVENPLDPANKDLLKAALYKYGMNINKPYQIQKLKHRNINGEVVYCELFIGSERKDTRWLFFKRRFG